MAEIRLDTREGNHIPNQQYRDRLDPSTYAKADYLMRRYLGIIVRTKPSEFYNCHGLTFASRRTGIYDDGPILQKILNDDQYKEIPKEEVLPGDIVLYFSDDGGIQHSGIVMERPNELNIPMILSKWGGYFEAIHPVHVVPSLYGNKWRYYRIFEKK